MPYKDIEVKKEYQKKYQQTPEQRIKQKKYRDKMNKEKQREYSLKYYYDHKEKMNLQNKEYCKTHRIEIRNYRRNHYLHSERIHGKDNQFIIIYNKRLYPLDNKCELCGKIPKKLVYHHWNNEHLEFGMWVCHDNCHWIGEALDTPNFENLKNKYLNLKEIIEHTEIIIRGH
jgi:hypothetical protein